MKPKDSTRYPSEQRTRSGHRANACLRMGVLHYLCTRLCHLFGFEGMPFLYGAAFFCVDYQAVRKNMHKFENNTCAVLLR